MEAQFIGYGIMRGLGDLGFWLAISLLLVFAPMFWRISKCSNCILKTERKEYPAANITKEAIEDLYRNFDESDYILFDSNARDSLLKQFWATDLRSLIEGKIIEQRAHISPHFLITTISSVIAPFTNDVPVFVVCARLNDGSRTKIHISATELEKVFPCLADMDWRQIVRVGNLFQTLNDLGPIIQYEETLRKISIKN